MKSTVFSSRSRGFSMIELTIALAIIVLLSAFSIQTFNTALRSSRLRGAAADYAGLLEQGRMLAIRDNRYYSTYILAPANNSEYGFVDLLPKGTGGASGNGTVDSGEPVINFSTEVTQQAVANAPNTNNLKTQLLPSTTPVTPTDTSATAATFGPRGLPCTAVNVAGGSVCDVVAGGPTAFWTFFKDNVSSNWQAVTITPAGRIQKWYYNGSTWSKM
jgi:prepilin-type N-terminal cleavage/methylation domain-containing protein